MSFALLFVFENTVFIFCFYFKNCVKWYDTILGKYDSYLPNFEIIDFRASGLLSFRTVKFLEAASHSLGDLKPRKLQNLIILSDAS